jgi:hypothetical protein
MSGGHGRRSGGHEWRQEAQRHMGNEAFGPRFDKPKALGERGDETEVTKGLGTVGEGAGTAARARRIPANGGVAVAAQ